ncbi:replication initiation protein [Anaerophilus nitritogenes]|uniref:replication initiation protein n=1 Tax=Anaerophilus nitritogenes TaxID=2498136 RepID=UPI00101BFE71|nr:replication initiation protein [Anaerophilus nitritogenes]
MSKNYMVTKSNALIEASYKLTLGEQKLILLLVSMIQPSDKEFKEYQISVKDFMESLDIKNKNKYKQVEQITKNLMTKVLRVHKERSTLQISWLSSAEYFKGEGMVEVCFDPKLKPYLLQLKENFTSYKLKNIIRLKSYYSMRIYELLKQYEKIRERVFSLVELRDILGMEPKQYKQYANLKQKVLQVAHKEINKKTDIYFEFEEIKQGRKVDKIKFYIESKNNKLPKDDAFKEIAATEDKKAEFDPFVFSLKQIIKEDLTDDELKAILDTAKYDMTTIIKKYELAKSSTYDNLVGFLISAIKKDYKEPIKQTKNNRFHNFEGRTSKYTKEELEEKLRMK